METAQHTRTMTYKGMDDWGHPTYRCLETGHLWKDLAGGSGTPELYSCGNQLDGDPDMPIKDDLLVSFRTRYEASPHRYSYALLSRLQGDCEYYLGWGQRSTARLWGGTVAEHLAAMKELYHTLPAGQEPTWLTYEDILAYERRMNTDC